MFIAVRTGLPTKIMTSDNQHNTLLITTIGIIVVS